MAHFLADPPDDLKPFDFDDKDGGDDFDDEIGGPIDEDFIPDEDLYDAINDETFGEEMAALTADDDFADFAIRTANLALFDDEPSTSLEPPDPSQIPIPQIDRSQNLQFIDSCKTAALKKKNVIPSVPPSGAGQIPSSSIWATGSFNGIGSLSELYMGNQPKPTSQESTHQHSFQTHSIDIDQLPNFSSSIGPPPGLFKPQTRSPHQQQTATTTSSATGPLNAEELERKMLQEVAASQMKNQNRPINPPASLNSAELEHKMLAEAMEAQQRQKQEQTMQEMMRIINGGGGQKTPMTMMTTPTMPNTAAATMTPPPPIWHQQYLAARMMHAATAASASNGNVQAQSAAPMTIFSNSNDHPMPTPPMWSPNILPPPPANSSMPIPPPPHQIYQQWQKFLQQFAASNAGPGMPPPIMPQFPPSFLPPFPPGPPPPGIHHPMAFHQQQKQNLPPPANASISTPIPHPMPPPPHLLPSTTAGYSTPSMPLQPPQIVDMVPASLHPHVEKQRRHRQANSALPSGKTIADYALDPYAGLMSTKEREWLIKIHIIQCLGTGDPMEDDFYYASWKQKNVLAKAPIVEGGQENPKYYKFEPTFPATNYTAPSFMGALGKPVHSSSRIPRQIIEVGNENLEDESLVGGKQTAANRQKRLRAMLMKIENGALMLIDCRDIHRKLRFFEDTCITEFIDKSEITERLERFTENLANVEASIFAADQIPTVMLIQKGRQLIFEWLQFLGNNAETRPKILTFLGTLINGMSKFAKKIPEESFGAFIGGFRSACMQIPCQTDLLNLVRTVNVETTAIADSKLIQLTLLTILIQLVQQNVANSSSSSSTLTTPITLPFSLQQLFDSPIYSLLFDIQVAALKIQSDHDGGLMHFDKGQWKLLHQWLIGEKQKWGQIIGFGQDNLANWICLKKWRR